MPRQTLFLRSDDTELDKRSAIQTYGKPLLLFAAFAFVVAGMIGYFDWEGSGNGRRLDDMDGSSLQASSLRGRADMLAASDGGSCAAYGCENRYFPDNSCQCNAGCEKFGNCCKDHDTACADEISGARRRRNEGPTASCAKYGCETHYDPDEDCQCNSRCSKFGNCCDDYLTACPDSAPAPTPQHMTCDNCPVYRDPSVRISMKGISYGPSPEMKEGVLLPNDDFMSPMAAIQWDSWGRGDLDIMKSIGANTVRLYGNDPSQDHDPFLTKAESNGLSVIAGLSDYPYLQMPGNCKETEYNCFKQIYDSYKLNLENGFTTDGKRSYHKALKALIVVNEPELKMGHLGDQMPFCRSVVSAVDGILQAEKDVGVTENLVALTVTVSFAKPFGAPGLGQMKKLHQCFSDPSASPTSYQAQNDVTKAYFTRWVNSLNTFNPPSDIKRLLFDPYPASFWKHDLKIPVFIGEYHNLEDSVKSDLHKMVSYTNRYPFFMGFSYFEFSMRYDKSGKNRETEIKYGMYGLDEDCVLGPMTFFCSWGADGSPIPQSYKVRGLYPRKDTSGHGTQERGVASAYGGVAPKHGCKHVNTPADASSAADAALEAACPRPS